MRHILCIIATFLAMCGRVCGSLAMHEKDSAYNYSEDFRLRHESEKRFCKFRGTQIIAPAILIGAGVTGLAVPAVRSINRSANDYFDKPKYPRIYVDDFAQYVPLVSVYGLNLSGVRGRHSYLESTIIIATSYIAMGAMVNAVKYTVRERRPDGSARNSFPSGHTATAFMGAEILRMEYKEFSPWIGVGAYVLASGIGVCRVYNHRHWVTDVLAGAGIGILSAKVGYWMFPVWQRLFFSGRRAGRDRYANCTPFYDGRSLGAAFSMTF